MLYLLSSVKTNKQANKKIRGSTNLGLSPSENETFLWIKKMEKTPILAQVTHLVQSRHKYFVYIWALGSLLFLKIKLKETSKYTASKYMVLNKKWKCFA